MSRANADRRLARMKQKFHSQVNMERVFFFDGGSRRAGRWNGEESHEVWDHRRGAHRQDSCGQRRGAQGLPGALRRRRRSRPPRRRSPRRPAPAVAAIDAILGVGRDRRGRHLRADRHARRPDREGGARREGDLLREADRSRREARSRLPRGGRQGGGRDADGRLQPTLRSELRGAAGAHRRGRDRRPSKSSRSPRAIPDRRRCPTSPARAACSAT